MKADEDVCYRCKQPVVNVRNHRNCKPPEKEDRR